MDVFYYGLQRPKFVEFFLLILMYAYIFLKKIFYSFIYTGRKEKDGAKLNQMLTLFSKLSQNCSKRYKTFYPVLEK